MSDMSQYNRPRELLKIIGIEKDQLSKTALETIEAYQSLNQNEEEFLTHYDDFRWKITAFIYIQDIFDSPLFLTDDPLNIFHIWYFYYESKYILIESILCGLNAFYSASNALLRLFLEFSILQNYYYRITHKEQNYKALEKYFKYKTHPAWNSVLNKALPDDKFSKPIKARLDIHLKKLSQIASHPYHPQFSPKQHAGFIPEPSFQGMFFWHIISIILEAVLWAYYVNFPMMFHPVDPLKKFGFNGPVGIFIDEIGSYIVKKSLPETDYLAFLKYSKEQEQVKALLEDYHLLRSLNDKEILDTWNTADNGSIEEIPKGYCMQMAKLRTLKEVMALKPVRIEDDLDREIDVSKVFQYEKWKQLYKKIKR